MKYNKPPLNIAQQIQTLQDRGLIINDIDRAKRYLSFISLYRLRAYTYTYQDNKNSDHPFYKGVTFNRVLNTYLFDRKLRLLIFDAIERVEIAFRTQIIYHYSVGFGSNWYEDVSFFKNENFFYRDLKLINKELKRSNENFIKHYRKKYAEPVNPPAWMTLETWSLSLLSKVFENLKINRQKKSIARNFNLVHPRVLESWMHSISVIRNICAHHGRLWNRDFPSRFLLPKKTLTHWLSNTNIPDSKLYVVLCSLLYLLNTIIPGNHFVNKFKKLITQYPEIPLKQMGFPDNWKKEQLWSNK
jgi:abortive infection bacteriophage resistance protein